MKSKDINNIIVKYLSGNADNNDEVELLLSWLKENHENRLYYFKQKRIWIESIVAEKNADHADIAWQRLDRRIDRLKIEKENRKQKYSRYYVRQLSIAASFAALLAFSVFFGVKLIRLNSFQQNIMEVQAPLGSRSKILLPDGTSVWLNSGSRLTYENNFGLKSREVQLIGEAYFDVMHIGSSKFIVNTPELKFEVLGTEFNIKAYPDEKVIETTLIDGKIKVDPQQVEEDYSSIVLKPKQKLVYEKDSKNMNLTLAVKDGKEDQIIKKEKAVSKTSDKISISKVMAPEDETAWKDEKLIIRSESLISMARKLERHYNVEITFKDEAIKDYHFSGTLDKVTIEEVMRAIESTAPVKYSIHRNKIDLELNEK